ncbi:hypothetical protein PS2_003238 [Malus domestica]
MASLRAQNPINKNFHPENVMLLKRGMEIKNGNAARSTMPFTGQVGYENRVSACRPLQCLGASGPLSLQQCDLRRPARSIGLWPQGPPVSQRLRQCIGRKNPINSHFFTKPHCNFSEE